MRVFVRLTAVMVVSALWAARAGADESSEASLASFALVIGSNASVDTGTAPLKYADDDAARYFDLFRRLGTRTFLVTRLDENTRRLHVQAAAEAREPRRRGFDAAVDELTQEVQLAKSRGIRTSVFIVYAGHGNVEGDEGYVTLEDSRITGADLAKVVERIPATRIHVIVDACSSFYLANARGPGGERRQLVGFRSSGLTADPRVGLLLSTSSARESHEWDRFQSGVFSHEIRSGMYGAADVDGDGIVSYPELAAFVRRAGAAIPNEKYRPDVFARPPAATDAMLDIRGALSRRLVIDARHAGHYFIEDSRGVRLMDAHNPPGLDVRLVMPQAEERLFVRRTDDDAEYVVGGTRDVVTISELTPAETSTHARGAAHAAFSLLFALPFDEQVVADYRSAPPPATVASPDVGAPPALGLRKKVALGALAGGVVAAGIGTYFVLAANATADATSPTLSNAEAAERQDRMAAQQTTAIVAYGVGAVALGTAATLWFWPSAKYVRATPLPGGGFVGIGTPFF